MNFKPSDISALEKIIKIANIANINSVLVNGSFASGINDTNTCVITSNTSGIELVEEGEPIKMALNRLDILQTRINIFKNDSYSINGNVRKDKKYNYLLIDFLDIKGKNAKCSFRTASPEAVRGPKGVNANLVAEFTILKDEFIQIAAASKSMGEKTMLLALKRDGTASFEFNDSVKDRFIIDLQTPFTILSNEDKISVVSKYFSDLFFAFVKKAGFENPTATEFSMKISDNGILKFEMNDFEITIMPAKE
ncbi:MAG: hypothetical protein QXN55_01590 [Candidatus Nitrosotenuis sp.]